VTPADRLRARLGLGRVDSAPAQPARFVPVTDEAGLDDAWARSRSGPVVLFNYDPG
jgi:hypothetical protein